jgi:hypothetical protein
MGRRSLLLAAVIAAFTALGVASPRGETPGPTTVTIAAPQAYLPSRAGGARDDYRCFLLDPRLDRDMFLTQATFRPGYAPIVHHIILFRVPPQQVSQAKALDRAAPGTGWRCFGGTGVDNLSPDGLEDADWAAAWAPVRANARRPDGIGVPLVKGSQLIMQVHYSLFVRPRPDRTRAVLTLVPQEGSSIQPLRTMLLPAPVELPCLPSERGPLCDRDAALADLGRRHGPLAPFVPAGLLSYCGFDATAPVPSRISTCQLRFDEPATIRITAGHMHLLGKSLTLELNPGTAQAHTILSIPRWDFHDQRMYVPSEPVHVATGDTLKVTCVYDQRLRHAHHYRGPREPRYVLWGEGTGDEMCLGVLQVTSG